VGVSEGYRGHEGLWKRMDEIRKRLAIVCHRNDEVMMQPLHVRGLKATGTSEL
jgi:hypothetical protein